MGFLCSFGIASGKVFRFCSSDIGFLSPDVERQLTCLALFGILALFVYDLVYFSRQTGSLGPIVLLFFIVPAVYAAMTVFLGFKFVALWRFLAALRFFLANNPSYLLATPLACGVLYLSGLCLTVLGRSVHLRVFGYGVRFCLWLARLAGCIYGGLRTLAVTLSETKAFSSICARLICVTALSWGFACSVLKSLTCWVRSILRLVNPLAAQVDAQAALILDLQATIADQKASLAVKESAITDMHAMLADKEAAFDDLSVLLRKSNESYEAANASLEAANASIVEKDNAIQKVTVTLNGACALAAQRETALVAKCEAVEELEISLQDKVETIGNMAESIRILDLSLAGSREEATRYKRLSEDLQLKLSKRRDENDHLSALLRDNVLSNTHKDEVIDKQAAKMQRMTHQDEEKSCRIADLEATVSEIKLKLRDTRLANEKQEVQLRAKIDTIDGLREKVIALEASVDQSRLKALRVERAHSKEIEDALNLQLELQVRF
ncbi:hypothetical protein ONZ51_g11037 [Trametes cubensis]|uniref:Uncharacterized protein n=1 Tax=Trametes cubensis TaxID=1111947 RepID=A0AAD7TIP7_9APHY|nr:hypothetical protein ONZ51_g11037 [Trametes cubensis]